MLRSVCCFTLSGSVLFVKGHWVDLPPWPRFSAKLLCHWASCISLQALWGQSVFGIVQWAVNCAYGTDFKWKWWSHIFVCACFVFVFWIKLFDYITFPSCFLCRFFYFVHTEFSIYCIWWARWAAIRPGALGKKRYPLPLTHLNNKNRYRWVRPEKWKNLIELFYETLAMKWDTGVHAKTDKNKSQRSISLIKGFLFCLQTQYVMYSSMQLSAFQVFQQTINFLM